MVSGTVVLVRLVVVVIVVMRFIFLRKKRAAYEYHKSCAFLRRHFRIGGTLAVKVR